MKFSGEKKGDRTLKLRNVHCQKQWASLTLGVKFSGGKKGTENEKSWEVMKGHCQVSRGSWEVSEGSWEVSEGSNFELQSGVTHGGSLRCSLPTAMGISTSEIFRGKRKQEHRVSYRCSLPMPLQIRSEDYQELQRIPMNFKCFEESQNLVQ